MVNPLPGDDPPADDGAFFITVRNRRQSSIIFKVRTNYYLNQIIHACARGWGLDANTLVLMYNRHSFTVQSTFTVGDVGFSPLSNIYCTSNTAMPGAIVVDDDSDDDTSVMDFVADFGADRPERQAIFIDTTLTNQ